MSVINHRPTAYATYFFDLGGTLVAIENDEIYRDETRHVTILEGVQVCRGSAGRVQSSPLADT